MDGYVAIRAIRELPEGGQVKVLAVTASVFEEQRDEILAVGCDELVRKPVREDEIFDAIARLLEVEYLHKDIIKARTSWEAPALTAEMLSGLPAELLDQLRHAALTLDRAGITLLIKRIYTRAPDTAKALQMLMDNYQFGKIQGLLGEVNEL